MLRNTRNGWRAAATPSGRDCAWAFPDFAGPIWPPMSPPLLPRGTSVRSFPASGLGLEVQWARGHWSASGEWQRFQYDLPGFIQAPSVISTYGEAKRILTPRFYVAGRAGWLKPGGAADASGASTSQFAPWIASYELGGGLVAEPASIAQGELRMAEGGISAGNAEQCCGSPVRHHVPRPRSGVSLNRHAQA